MTDPTPARPSGISFNIAGHDLLEDSTSWLTRLHKSALPRDFGHSKQGALRGTQPHLIDYAQAGALKNNNVHHSTCLEAKRDALVGLGHKNSEIDKILSPLCNVSWQDTLNDVAADYWEFGNGYLEVVRNKEGEIKGLHHMPCPHVWVFVEKGINIYHFEITNNSRLTSTATLKFARYGDLQEFIQRNRPRGKIPMPNVKRISETSEVIHFPRSTNRSRHYGYIDWAAATPSMELEACVTQYEFDFFFNGGIPDGIFSVTGDTAMDTDDWEKIEAQFKAFVGLGNRRKVMLLHLGGLGLTSQFDKIGVDGGGKEGGFKDFSDTLALKVVSAHRVPPLLAGIVIPGKLGAANELTNAMMAFQTLAISGPQKHVSRILGGSLGDPAKNGGLPLTSAMFLGEGEGDPEIDPTKGIDETTGMPAMRPKDNKGNGFNTILEEIDLGQAETIGKMRQPLMQAQAEGRNLDEGVKERGEEK